MNTKRNQKKNRELKLTFQHQEARKKAIVFYIFCSTKWIIICIKNISFFRACERINDKVYEQKAMNVDEEWCVVSLKYQQNKQTNKQQENIVNYYENYKTTEW